MPFVKGNIPWNKGKKMPKEFSENLKTNYSGKNHPFYGRKHSKATKENMSLSRKGKNLAHKNSNWKGGKKIVNGYVYIYSPTHPNAIQSYVLKHRLVMEKHLGRFLKKSEVVHHIDGNPLNNKISNLKLFHSQRAHTIFHETLRGIYNERY